MKLQTSIKLVGSLADIILVLALYIGIETSNWSYFGLLIIPFTLWLFLDLKFHYIKLHPIYTFVVPFLIVCYTAVSFFIDDYVTPLIILAFIPFLIMFHNVKFYPFKFAIVPLAATFIGFLYVTIGIFFGIWHPTWLIFVLSPMSLMFVNFGD